MSNPPSADDADRSETFVCIDFEASGRKLRLSGGDHIFGFGVAIGHIDHATGPVVVRSLSVAIRPCPEPPTSAAGWRKLWQERGWDMNACNERWIGTDDARPLDGLAQLNAMFVPCGSHTIVDNYGDAAALLDATLHEADPFTLLVDNIGFEPWIASMLLVEHGFEPLTHSRSGQYRGACTFDESSMMVYREDPKQKLPRSRAIARACVNHHFAGVDAATQNPRWDAVELLCRVLFELLALKIMH